MTGVGSLSVSASHKGHYIVSSSSSRFTVLFFISSSSSKLPTFSLFIALILEPVTQISSHACAHRGGRVVCGVVVGCCIFDVEAQQAQSVHAQLQRVPEGRSVFRNANEGMSCVVLQGAGTERRLRAR